MLDYEEKQLEQILRISEESIRNLSTVWRRTFDKDICEDNLRRLNEHAKNFYNDLIKESLQKEEYIKKEIDELHCEAKDLQRLLKVEVELPEIAKAQDIPLLVIQREMDKSLCDLREQLQRRQEQICDLLLEQESICEELGEPPRPLLADPLPTAEELQDFRDYLDNLQVVRDERIQNLHQIRREIKNYLQILNLNVNTEYDDRLLNHRQLQLSKETFDGLEKLRNRFKQQVEELKTLIDNMREKLPALWDRLNTPDEERQVIERYQKYDQFTADKLYEELTRCEALKRQNIKHYIQKVRAEIEHWWNLTLKSDKERRRFTHFTSHNYSDELLTLHEMELDDLKQHYQNNQQIYELFADRNILWERMAALEQKASDPGRYNNRGGQLLKEEKERKTIATKLPKIEQQIKELVQNYEEHEHTPFLVYGEDILQVMEADWEKKRQEKEAHSNARKNAVTPQANINRSHVSSAVRTPLIQRNASSSMLRKTPSTMSLSTSKHTNAVGGSALKRKLHPSDKTTPNAKRSLWQSPHDVFRKPTAASATKASANKATETNHARKKLPRVLATTIRRRLSGRLSANGSITKRRSMNKSGRATNKPPKIVINEPSSNDEENYDAFKNRISPDSRSSIRHESTILKSSANKLAEAKRKRQQQKIAAIKEAKEEKKLLSTLPKPQVFHTPSKRTTREFPVSPGTSININRKLTTKNLPIII